MNNYINNYLKLLIIMNENKIIKEINRITSLIICFKNERKRNTSIPYINYIIDNLEKQLNILHLCTFKTPT
jgi:hypothetical protein